MSKEQNKAAQEKFGEAITTGKLELIRDVVSENVVEHDPAPNQGPGPQGYIDFFTTIRSAFPDFDVE
ncbi:MAG: ester cyclase, partial [Leeuwenhoekiella sp.]